MPSAVPGLVKSSSEAPAVGQLRSPTSCGFFFSPVYFGQTKVQNLGVPAIGDENVRGLDVPMNDSLRVRGVQRIGNFGPQFQQLLDRRKAFR